MIKIQGTIPNKVGVAVSGGPDSMAVLDFLRKGKKEVTALFFHHGTQESRKGREIVLNYCGTHHLSYKEGVILDSSDTSEAYFREERYEWLHSQNIPVITCHHLDDCVEEYIISTLKRGFSSVIPYFRYSEKYDTFIFRPFRLTPKYRFISWCDRNSITTISSVGDDLRTNLRSHVVPVIKSYVNPGITNMVRRMMINETI